MLIPVMFGVYLEKETSFIIMGMSLYHSAHMEVRGQLRAINFPFHIYLGSGDQTQVLKLKRNAPLPHYWWPCHGARSHATGWGEQSKSEVEA